MRQAATETEDRAVEQTGGFDQFFQAHHARLYGTLCLVTGDRAEAEDVMQDAFLKLWERWDRVREHPDPGGYLYRTAFNLFRSRLRRVARAARRLVTTPPQTWPSAFGTSPRGSERRSCCSTSSTSRLRRRPGPWGSGP
jgi:RNA polymerase sigma factor (sigma-70 family)